MIMMILGDDHDGHEDSWMMMMVMMIMMILGDNHDGHEDSWMMMMMMMMVTMQ